MNFEHQIIRVFQSTTNSYKYYWWYSILQLIKEKRSIVLKLDEIAIKMIVLAWYPVNYYKISLGKQDQISTHIKYLQNQFIELKDDIKEDILFQFLIENRNNDIVKEVISKLIKYVPFRFIRPWFDATKGIKDGLVHKQILTLQHSITNSPPYYINLHDNEILFNEEWHEWMCFNVKILESYTLLELFKYVEKNNPYVTNISVKLFKPNARNLTIPSKLWREFIVLHGNELTSVFENKPLLSLTSIAIDHYLPWSLVTHDKLWNLHPIEKDVNSSKSNRIADRKYLDSFAHLQHEFVIHLSKTNAKFLGDYFTLFLMSESDLLNLSKNKFCELLNTKINIETDLAINLSFDTKWSYLNQY
jgi:hypothetical protein